MRFILNKKNKEEKVMTERKKLKFRKDESADPAPSPPETFDDKLARIKDSNVPSPNKASETPNRSPSIQSAPVNQPQQRPRLPAIETPRDVSAEIQSIIQAYKGDLVRTQEFILANFEGADLYTAGFQICLILTNERIARENALREIFENMRRGTITVPFDPREDPLFLTLIKRIIPSQVPRQVTEQVPEKETVQVPAKEDYTTRREQKIAELHAMIDAQPGGTQ
jgi:hypothetical protein